MRIEGVTSSYVMNSMKLEENLGTDQTKSIEQQDRHLRHNNGKEKSSQLPAEEAKHIVNGLNEFLQPKFTSVSFRLHEELNRYYVEVVDKETKEVIREIPDKDLLDIYSKMTEYLGLFIDEKL